MTAGPKPNYIMTAWKYGNIHFNKIIDLLSINSFVIKAIFLSLTAQECEATFQVKLFPIFFYPGIQKGCYQLIKGRTIKKKYWHIVP